MNITSENKIISKKEFQLDEVPQSICCFGSTALIQSAMGYLLLNFENSSVQRILDKGPERENVPMAAMAFYEQYLLTGPGGLGVFITTQGMPGSPPIQLSSNNKSVGEIDQYLAVDDCEFVTIYGRGENSNVNDPIEQLQIIPIPGVKHIIYSER